MANANDGLFVWYELMTKDPKAAIAFYSEVAGWKTEPFGDGSYTMWVGSQGPLGGVYTMPEQAAKKDVPPMWIGSVRVANVDATVSLIKKLGGKAHMEAEDIPGVGRYAVVTDPQTATFAIFSPSREMPAHDTMKHGEFGWNELLTSDSAAAFKFYEELFGWKIHQEMDMGPMGTYRIYGTADKALGGMMTTPQKMQPAWLYYVEVADVEAAMGRATRQGAKVMNGPMDVPDGGRIVQMMDPQGAMFALHRGPQK
jgi:hypothetical protein